MPTKQEPLSSIEPRAEVTKNDRPSDGAVSCGKHMDNTNGLSKQQPWLTVWLPMALAEWNKEMLCRALDVVHAQLPVSGRVELLHVPHASLEYDTETDSSTRLALAPMFAT